MHRYGQLSILGISPQELDDDIFTLLVDEDTFSRLESYKELVDRRSQAEMTPERAFSLIYNVTDGTLAEKLAAASSAAIEVTPIKDESFG